MTERHDLRNAVYPVGERRFSALDLLNRFTQPEYQKDGISRISDLHLKVGEPARFRFDSELVPLPEATEITEEIMSALLFPLLEQDQIERLQSATPNDVDASFQWEEKRLSFRINAFRDREGLACTIRVLPREIPDLDTIGFPTGRVTSDLLGMKQGLVIVTGITGSGKSTTIASVIEAINKSQYRRIITLEDPIEYVIPSRKSLISQRELGRHISSFHLGLRSALREDPDIIFVGEMRDRETIALALTAAETGHLVLSTLHTKDSRGAVSRIVDMYPAERTKEVATQLSFSLSYILAQKLVPRRRGGGRRVAMEVLKNTSAISHLIRAGNWHQIYSALETQTKEGLNTLEKHLAELVKAGEVSAEDALRYANDSTIQNWLNAL